MPDCGAPLIGVQQSASLYCSRVPRTFWANSFSSKASFKSALRRIPSLMNSIIVRVDQLLITHRRRVQTCDARGICKVIPIEPLGLSPGIKSKEPRKRARGFAQWVSLDLQSSIKIKRHLLVAGLAARLLLDEEEANSFASSSSCSFRECTEYVFWWCFFVIW